MDIGVGPKPARASVRLGIAHEVVDMVEEDLLVQLAVCFGPCGVHWWTFSLPGSLIRR
jgi:hypothetical protein